MDRGRQSVLRFVGALGSLGLLTIGLLVANGAARSFLESPSTLARFRTENAWRAVWLLRHSGPDDAIGSVHDAFDPECGWTLPAGLRNQRLPHGGIVNSNQRGVRGVREYALARTPGTGRIVTIGDSFTFGDDVDDADTFSAQLERDLSSTEVLNLGIHGYGHDQMLIRLQRDGLPYAPDIVVLGVVDADGERNVMAFRDYLKPRFELRDGRLERTNVPVVPPAEYLRAHGWEPSLLLLLRVAGDRFAARHAPDRIDAMVTALLTEIVRVTRGAGAIPLFVYLPEPELRHDAAHRLRAFCREQAIDCVFPETDLHAARTRGMSLVRGTHYSPEAHGVIASAIARYIRERGLLASATAEPSHRRGVRR
jgi:hypothetical protein